MWYHARAVVLSIKGLSYLSKGFCIIHVRVLVFMQELLYYHAKGCGIHARVVVSMQERAVLLSMSGYYPNKGCDIHVRVIVSMFGLF